MNKNILYIWSADWPWDIRIDKEIQTLLDNSYEVSILARNTNNLPIEETDNNLKIYRIHNYIKNTKINNVITTPIYFNPIWVFEIFNIIKHLKPDIIIIRDIPLAPISIFIAKIFNIKIVLDMAENFPALIRINEKYISNPINKFLICNCNLYKWIEKYSVLHSDKIFTVIEESKERLLREYEICDSKISIISNTPVVIPKALNRNTDSKKLKIVYTGNIDGEFRGIQTLIKTAEILKNNSDIEISIVGSGSYLKKILSETDIKALDNLNMLGYMQHEELLEYLKTQDIGIVPHIKCDCINYTIPNKLFDYMAHSLPIIVSSAKPLKRIVEGNDCGYVFESGNPQSLADLLIYIKNNKQELENKGKNGYNAVKEKYNWEYDGKELLKVIKNLEGINA